MTLEDTIQPPELFAMFLAGTNATGADLDALAAELRHWPELNLDLRLKLAERMSKVLRRYRQSNPLLVDRLVGRRSLLEEVSPS